MTTKEWTELYRAIGTLQGLATVLDMAEDIDPKKLNTAITGVTEILQRIADSEGTKLEDLQVVKKPAQKKSGGTKCK